MTRGKFIDWYGIIKNISVLCPFTPGIEPQKPCANEVTQGGYPENFRVGAGHQKDQTCDSKVGTLGQTGFQGEEGAENLVQLHIHLFNQACLHNETPIKTLDTKAQWDFLVGEPTDVLGE